MASIRKHIHVVVSPADAWDTVRDYGAVHERVAEGFVTSSDLDGDDRIVTFVTGAVVRERLVTVDDERRRLVYSVVASARPDPPSGLSRVAPGVAGPDVATRNRAILVHLERMHQQLEQTQATPWCLCSLCNTDGPHPRAPVVIRRIPARRVVAARATVAFDVSSAWLEPTLADLHAAADQAGLKVVGADGALYPDEFFESGAGDVTAFVPVASDASPSVELPAMTVAVLLHDGPFADLDQAYGALGTVAAERGIGGPGPIREHYLTETSAEVCWPVTTGATS